MFILLLMLDKKSALQVNKGVGSWQAWWKKVQYQCLIVHRIIDPLKNVWG